MSGPSSPRHEARYSATWQPLDLSSLTDRLATARDLLRQAAALTAARETQRLGAMVDHEQQRMQEEEHGQPRRRRYR
jgi:hypothetical protein